VRLVGQETTQNDLQAGIKLRGADVYASFLPHLRPGATVLDCGCGVGTIALGLAEAVSEGHVVGVDLDLSGLKGAQRAAVSLGHQNVSWIGADGRSLPFHSAVFDAVLCHSMLGTLDDPALVIAELRRVTKRGGVVGAASVEYDGIILSGEPMAGPRRFYDISQKLWWAAGIAEPNMGQRLRGLFQAAGFGHVEAFADYISYGTLDRVRTFASDRAAECRDRELHVAVTRYGIASAEELLDLAAAWEKWGDDPSAFFAFAWCRVLAWC
jgi:ubiquinone/menaquinone biosynthesis C-methylase UbiE